jgi:phosphoribosylglycinamide formyltransferase-1
MQPTKHIAVFASGTGTTLQALIDNQHTYGYHVALVVTNRACQAQERAQATGIPTLLSKDWERTHQQLNDHHVQLIVLAGFLAIIPEWICAKWEHRIINIHPSLLPRHGGKGMYGIRVQEAVLAAGDTIAGCTVHYVSAEVDGGSIIAQATVPVLPNDTPETLSARVQHEEKLLLPRTIATILHNTTQH